MNRLVRYVENELDRNSLFFAQAESSMMAALDFINYVLTDKNLVELSEEEVKYVNKVKESYHELQRLNREMLEEIAKYKEAYVELFKD